MFQLKAASEWWGRPLVPHTSPQRLQSIILRAEKDDIEIEYALRSKANPAQLGSMAAYELQSKLPNVRQLADIVRVEMAGK